MNLQFAPYLFRFDFLVSCYKNALDGRPLNDDECNQLSPVGILDVDLNIVKKPCFINVFEVFPKFVKIERIVNLRLDCVRNYSPVYTLIPDYLDPGNPVR